MKNWGTYSRIVHNPKQDGDGIRILTAERTGSDQTRIHQGMNDIGRNWKFKVSSVNICSENLREKKSEEKRH